MNSQSSNNKRQYKSKNHSRRQRPKQTIVQASEKLPNSIAVGAKPELWINNPIIKKTKSGHEYIEHEELANHRLHPNCFCHCKTWINREYFQCENCNEHHFVLCIESPFDEEDEIYYSTETKCVTCIYNPNYQQNAKRD